MDIYNLEKIVEKTFQEHLEKMKEQDHRLLLWWLYTIAHILIAIVKGLSK